jgi:hypothetical protein
MARAVVAGLSLGTRELGEGLCVPLGSGEVFGVGEAVRGVRVGPLVDDGETWGWFGVC